MDTPVEHNWNADESSNVASALSWQARRQPNATAIHYPKAGVFGKEKFLSCTYQELDELSDSYARGLVEYGIGPGTRTALMLTPGLEFFAVFFALFKAGAVPVLIDPGIGMKPLRACLAEAAPKAFIGVTKAHVARKILGWAKQSCELLVTAGPSFGMGYGWLMLLALFLFDLFIVRRGWCGHICPTSGPGCGPASGCRAWRATWWVCSRGGPGPGAGVST